MSTKVIFLLLSLNLILISCDNSKVEGIYSSEGGPYFKFTNNQMFELGVPGDKNPLKGNFKQNGNKLDLVANAIILGSYSTTTFLCDLNKDTLTIDVLHITHPKFEIFIDKPSNYARTVRDNDTTEFKLNTPEAEQELFIYYKLVFDKFIKRNGG